MSVTIDLEPRRVDATRLPLRRRVPGGAVAGLVESEPLLAPLREPEVVVEVEVTAPRPDGHEGQARLRCRHGLAGGRVASTAWAGGDVEVAAYGVEHWQTELARAAEVPIPGGAPPPPEEELEVPLDVLLGAGDALRSGRPDVLDELVRRAGSADPAGLRDRVVRLHRSGLGRLQATAAGSDGETSRVGWVSWLLVADGWRSLTPVRRDGRPLVRVAPATPMILGVQVASLVTSVRGRS